LDDSEPKPASFNLKTLLLGVDNSSAWSAFIIDGVKLLKQPGYHARYIAMKFVLPESAGFCVRSDFLERRLEGLGTVVRVKSFLEPRQEIRRTLIPNENVMETSHLPQILSFSVGAMIVKDKDCLHRTEAELDNRLSYPWISPRSLPFRRVAYVRGRYSIDHSERIWESARALGIAVIVIDTEGHWLQLPEWAHLREAFIPANLDPDEGFADRLVAAVRSYNKPIHGITTVSNKRIVGVARACELLGLPTSPSMSFAIAADKYRTREIEPATDVTAFRVENVEALHARLTSAQAAPIHYPVVVKPCIGWASECIAKVNTQIELVKAVERASERHRASPIGRTDVMVETYIDGPEIDANVVLVDGEIVFFEVADDFPSLADHDQNKWDDPFQETWMVLPSQLPEDEVELIRKSLHDTLLRQGFKHGVFNCEGRVRHSRMKYGLTDDDEDLVEAEPRYGEAKGKPSFYLHEINARPPGYYGNVASNITYGVDYYALDFLFAVGDMERYRSLAYSFSNGPQWWLVIVVLPEKRAGTMITEDACREFLVKHKDIKELTADHMTWKRGGSKLQGPGASQLGFVGYMSVVSRRSRKEALQVASRVKKGFDYELA
jgi:biotin carboxylase